MCGKMTHPNDRIPPPDEPEEAATKPPARSWLSRLQHWLTSSSHQSVSLYIDDTTPLYVTSGHVTSTRTLVIDIRDRDISPRAFNDEESSNSDRSFPAVPFRSSLAAPARTATRHGLRKSATFDSGSIRTRAPARIRISLPTISRSSNGATQQRHTTNRLVGRSSSADVIHAAKLLKITLDTRRRTRLKYRDVECFAPASPVFRRASLAIAPRSRRGEYRLTSHHSALARGRRRISRTGNGETSLCGRVVETLPRVYQGRRAGMTRSRARALNGMTYTWFGGRRATGADDRDFWKWGSASLYVTRPARARARNELRPSSLGRSLPRWPAAPPNFRHAWDECDLARDVVYLVKKHKYTNIYVRKAEFGERIGIYSRLDFTTWNTRKTRRVNRGVESNDIQPASIVYYSTTVRESRSRSRACQKIAIAVVRDSSLTRWMSLHGKNGFTEISKSLATDRKIIWRLIYLWL